jgi:hypothetical protein
MNISNFDQNKKDSITFEGEAVRLSNEFRSKPARTFLNMYGNRVDIPAKRGFDIETCDFLTMANYLADSRIYKSESQIMLLHRIMSVRFPNEYTQNKSKIENRYNLEMELIESKSKNDISWFGEVGFQNKVRLDGVLTNNNNRVIENKDKSIKIIRK